LKSLVTKIGKPTEAVADGQQAVRLRPDSAYAHYALGFAYDQMGRREFPRAKADLSERLTTLLRDGPEVGIHVVIWSDTVGNLRRSLDRRALTEIGFRVGGAMSEQDSTELLDSPEAARLDTAHRMVFYDDERPGSLEKFRPYVIRDQDWLRTIRGTSRI
jgi:tetratricopeptide (TPR) repeat protein